MKTILATAIALAVLQSPQLFAQTPYAQMNKNSKMKHAEPLPEKQVG
jgi:hypothetical protein